MRIYIIGICVFMLSQCLYGQSQEDLVKKAMDSINFTLSHDFLRTKTDANISNERNAIKFSNYLDSMFPEGCKCVGLKIAVMFKNLNFEKKNYKKGSNPRVFIQEALNEYIHHRYDTAKVQGILDAYFKDTKKENDKEEILKKKVSENGKKENKTTIKKEEKTKPERKVKEKEEKEKKIEPVVFEEKLQESITDENNISDVQSISDKRTLAPNTINNEDYKLGDYVEPQNQYGFWVMFFLLGIGVGVFIAHISIKRKTPISSIPKPVTKVISKTEWLVVYGSEVGENHRIQKPPLPCQDAHSVLSLDEGWGVAVVCDGAGSAKYSDKGSEFVAKAAIKLFQHIIKENGWIEKKELPSKDDWDLLTDKAFRKLQYDLHSYSKKLDVPFKQLACTIIVVVYSPIGILCSHIGDGRAGYRDDSGTWKALMVPHQGEEANHTVFLTSEAWRSGHLKMNGVKVPESSVVQTTPTAFTLMSDGCEYHSFKIGSFDNEVQKVVDINEPYDKFFDGIIANIEKMYQEGKSQEEILSKWSLFLQRGTEDLEDETDDKTLIVGVRKESKQATKI